MRAILIGLLFGAAGLPVWLFIVAIVWYSLGRFERKLSRIEELIAFRAPIDGNRVLAPNSYAS